MLRGKREGKMFARITHYQMKPDKMADAEALIEKLKPQIMSLPGMQRFVNVSRNDGSGYVLSFVESEEVSNQNAPAVQAIWGNFKNHLTAMPVAEGYNVFCDWSN